jgi:hypothetical protein
MGVEEVDAREGVVDYDVHHSVWRGFRGEHPLRQVARRQSGGESGEGEGEEHNASECRKSSNHVFRSFFWVVGGWRMGGIKLTLYTPDRLRRHLPVTEVHRVLSTWTH